MLLFPDREDPTGAFLGYVRGMSVIVHVKVVDIPFVVQRLFPLVHLCRPRRFPSCSPLTIGSMSLLYRSSRFLVQSVRRQSRSHSCSSFSFLDKVVHSAMLCNDSAVWFRRLKTVLVRSCSLNVVDAPVTQVLRGAAGAVPVVMDVPVIMQRRWFATAQVGRALCTGTGPELTPAIWAEKGWRGRRESASQVTCHPN